MTTPSSSRSGRSTRRSSRRPAPTDDTPPEPAAELATESVEAKPDTDLPLEAAAPPVEVEAVEVTAEVTVNEPLPDLGAIAPTPSESATAPLPESAPELPPQEVVMAPSPESTLATVHSYQTVEDVQGIPLQLREDGSLPNGRPVALSRLDIHHTFGSFSLRPILDTHLEVVGMDEGRPVMANDFQIAEMINDAGARPIMASSLKIDRIVGNFGPRPVASNQIDPPNSDLMGYLD